MTIRVDESRSWVLLKQEKRVELPDSSDVEVATLRDIGRMTPSSARPGWPILLDLTDPWDDRLSIFFRDGFRGDQRSSAWTYAERLFLFFRFLRQSRGVNWDEVVPSDVGAFQDWRVYDAQNPRSVSAATWNGDLAAIDRFLRFGAKQGWVEGDVVRGNHRLGAAQSSSGMGGWKEKNARRSRDKWLTPLNLSMWRAVGLTGYQADLDSKGRVVPTIERDSFRGRNSARNVAFLDFLFTTGLRLHEAGSLLEFELPETLDVEVPVVGKGGRRRHYRVVHPVGVQSVSTYCRGERTDAIRRAVQFSRYDGLDRIDVAGVMNGRAGQRVRLMDGRVLDVPTMPLEQRQHLYVRNQILDAWVPAWLWLTESGLPMSTRSWHQVFNVANDRVSGARLALGVKSPWVSVSPHSLRFTFALFYLMAAVRAIDQRRGFDSATPFHVETYREAFAEVQSLLGHADETTTINIYLEPVKGLRRDPLLRKSAVAMWDALEDHSMLVGFGRETN